MASFLFLTVGKARLTSTRGTEEWGWAEETGGRSSVLTRVATCEVRVGYESWKPHQQQLELRQGGPEGLGSPGPERGAEVACVDSSSLQVDLQHPLAPLW